MSKRVRLYALSTCGWCKRAKRFFDENKIEAEVTDVDQLEGEAKEEARAEVAKYNPRRSYPTVIVDEDVVVGYDEERLKELLGL